MEEIEKIDYQRWMPEFQPVSVEDRVKWFNEHPFETKEHYDCPICLDKEIIQWVRENGNLASYPCECVKRKADQKRYAQVMAHSGLDKRYQRQTFENFQVHAPWMRDMLNTARLWAAGSIGWLLLCGQSGCGKTHLGLAACMERYHSRGQVPMILSWREFFTSQSKTAQKEAFLQRLREPKEAQLLYIDDFLKTARNPWEVPDWEQDLAFELIDYRYNTGLDTVISTEWTPEELRSINEAIAGRIIHAAGKSRVVVAKDPKKNFRYRVS